MSLSLDGIPPDVDSILRVQRDQKGSAAIFSCEGSFSLARHRELDELSAWIRRDKASQIVLDLSAVKQIDSVGVGTLAMILKYAVSGSRSLTLVCSKPVRDVLDTSNLDRAFRIAPSLDAALRG